MKEKNKKIIIILLSIFITIGLSVDLELQDTYENMFNITSSYTLLIIVIGVYVIINNAIKVFKGKKKDYLLIFISFIIASLQLIGYYFQEYDSLYNAYANMYQIFKSFVFVISLSFIFYYLLLNAKYYISKIKYKKNKNKIILEIFDKHPRVYPIIMIGLVYLLNLFIMYPGNMAGDGYDELFQYYHYSTFSVTTINLINEEQYINGHHSPFHTYLIGTINDIGTKLVDVNFGLFLNVLLQLIFALYVFGYLFKLLKELKAPYFYRIILLIIFTFLPIFSINICNVIKDVSFSYSLLLYSCLLIEYCYLDKKDLKTIIKLIFVSLIMGLLAKKGLYVLLITSIILFIYVIFCQKKKKMAIVFLIPIFLYVGYDKIILTNLEVTPGSVREMLAVPIQQIARTVINHEDSLNDDEKETIGNIIEYENIEKLYKPKIADGIKNHHFYEDYTSSELKEFMLLWIKLFFRYPGTYISAFLNQTSGYYIFSNVDGSFSFWALSEKTPYDMDEVPIELNYKKSSWQLNMTEKMYKFYNIISKLPIVGLLFNFGIYFWSSLLLLIYVFKKEKFKGIVPMIPLLVMLLMIFISPANNHARYIWPLVYMLPVVIPYAFSLMKKKTKSK